MHEKAGGRAQKISIHIETLAALLLLIVLASLTVLLLYATGSSYRRIVSANDSTQELRTGLFFVATKVRQSDGAVSVRSAPWGSALVLTQKTDEGTFEDWIFFYAGSLREGTVQAGTAINPGACPEISKLRSFAMAKNGGMLTITATADSGAGSAPQTRNLKLALRD